MNNRFVMIFVMVLGLLVVSGAHASVIKVTDGDELTMHLTAYQASHQLPFTHTYPFRFNKDSVDNLRGNFDLISGVMNRFKVNLNRDTINMNRYFSSSVKEMLSITAGNRMITIGGDAEGSGHSNDLELSTVPLPATVWLFGSALAGLALMAISHRRRN